jgi:CRISPR-associated exonuclease Cas4
MNRRRSRLKLRVSDIKQYIYCPRVVYYHYVLPVERKITRKMVYGKEEHIELDRLEQRRKFKRYGLAQGERRFHTHLYSARLNLEGKLDMHICAGTDFFPVEFKHTGRKVSLNHKYQLTAYAMLLEDKYNIIVRCGFVYLNMRNEVVPVEITPGMRLYIRQVIEKINRMIEMQVMPDATKGKNRCTDCEFRKFCGDVG